MSAWPARAVHDGGRPANHRCAQEMFWPERPRHIDPAKRRLDDPEYLRPDGDHGQKQT